MNRWIVARLKAYEVRSRIEKKLGRSIYGSEIVEAIIEDEAELDCLERPFNDSLLGNKNEGFDPARYFAQLGFIVINQDLPNEEIKAFYKAHELGHYFVHTRHASCQGDSIDPSRLVLTLPYAEGRIATYHPQQMQHAPRYHFYLPPQFSF